jgi:carboxypeptidase Taq
MSAPASAFGLLHAYLHQTRLLGSISSSLYYDQNTVMPAAGAPWRGEQLALLATQLHQRQSQQEYVDLLAAAEAELEPDSPPQSHRNLQLLRLELERQRCLDPDLVGRLAQAQSRGNALWQQARRSNDFPLFAPALQELLTLRRDQAPGKPSPNPSSPTSARPVSTSYSPPLSSSCRPC